MPRHMTYAERALVQLVESGELGVDCFGRVWRFAARRGSGNGGSSVLVPCTPRRAENATGDGDGYLQVRGTVNGQRWFAAAHRLVWQQFNDDIPAGLTINHIDGNKQNNHPSNLEPATDAEQVAHAMALGLRHSKKIAA